MFEMRKFLEISVEADICIDPSRPIVKFDLENKQNVFGNLGHTSVVYTCMRNYIKLSSDPDDNVLIPIRFAIQQYTHVSGRNAEVSIRDPKTQEYKGSVSRLIVQPRYTNLDFKRDHNNAEKINVYDPYSHFNTSLVLPRSFGWIHSALVENIDDGDEFTYPVVLQSGPKHYSEDISHTIMRIRCKANQAGMNPDKQDTMWMHSFHYAYQHIISDLSEEL